MNELRHISSRMKAAVAKIEAADALASESWQQLRTRHGWALLLAAGTVASFSAWWQLRRRTGPAPASATESAGEQARSDQGTALSSLRSVAMGLLPALLPQIAARLLPLPWRHLAVHPWVRMGLTALLGKVSNK